MYTTGYLTSRTTHITTLTRARARVYKSRLELLSAVSLPTHTHARYIYTITQDPRTQHRAGETSSPRCPQAEQHKGSLFSLSKRCENKPKEKKNKAAKPFVPKKQGMLFSWKKRGKIK